MIKRWERAASCWHPKVCPPPQPLWMGPGWDVHGPTPPRENIQAYWFAGSLERLSHNLTTLTPSWPGPRQALGLSGLCFILLGHRVLATLCSPSIPHGRVITSTIPFLPCPPIFFVYSFLFMFPFLSKI